MKIVIQHRNKMCKHEGGKQALRKLEGRIPLRSNRGMTCPIVPHRNAVESQEAKKANLGRKSGVMNWIGMAA
jgi:hypothetical protein